VGRVEALSGGDAVHEVGRVGRPGDEGRDRAWAEGDGGGGGGGGPWCRAVQGVMEMSRRPPPKILFISAARTVLAGCTRRLVRVLPPRGLWARGLLWHPGLCPTWMRLDAALECEAKSSVIDLPPCHPSTATRFARHDADLAEREEEGQVSDLSGRGKGVERLTSNGEVGSQSWTTSQRRAGRRRRVPRDAVVGERGRGAADLELERSVSARNRMSSCPHVLVSPAILLLERVQVDAAREVGPSWASWCAPWRTARHVFFSWPDSSPTGKDVLQGRGGRVSPGPTGPASCSWRSRGSWRRLAGHRLRYIWKRAGA
jgi:hypothetical protein